MPRPGGDSSQLNTRLSTVPIAGVSGLALADGQPPATDPGKQPPATDEAPVPRVLPFAPNQIRMPRLPAPLGATPQATAETKKEFGEYVQRLVDPQETLDLIIGRARLLVLKAVPKRIQIAEEKIANYAVVKPTELSLQGKQIGTTVLTLWFPDVNDPNKEKVLSYLVRVLPDPEARERLEHVYEALEREINHAFPDSHVRLSLAGDKLLVCGQAKDIVDATHILQIARANAPPDDTARIPVNQVNLVVPPGGLAEGDELAAAAAPALENYLVRGGPRIINMLQIPGEQQVSLRVIVAEVSRSALRTIGTNIFITNKEGRSVFQSTVGTISQSAAGLPLGIGAAATTGLNDINASIDNGQVALAISALKHLNYARMLAEPTLTSLNGHTANFRAGGEFPVPVVTGFTSAGLQGVGFVNFGVQLTFTPIILDHNRIRLTVAADISDVNYAAGTTNINGASVPSLTSRDFSTTVDLREGQTVAVAGLIQNSITADSQRIPFFGDIPVLGRLAAFDQHTTSDSELVVLVTPQLVHPLEPHELAPLSGANIVSPDDCEFYLLGRLQGRRGPDGVSSSVNDAGQMKKYRECEQVYIRGAHGHSDNP